MKIKKKRPVDTTGTAATVPGMAANSPEFTPGSLNDPKNDFTDSLNDVYDFIPELKGDKFR